MVTRPERMEEDLLTKEDIDDILIESAKPVYREKNLYRLAGKKTTIQQISQKTGLIVVVGNEFTGFQHILERHHPTSKAGKWIPGDTIKLDNPSRFSLGTVPIIDFINIADSVYQPTNKVTDDRNKNPYQFDLFIGTHKDRKNRISEYKLLTYKDTPIIHNLIPSKKKFNKKKVIDLRQGFAGSRVDLMRGLHTYYIPYYDHLNVERARIVVRLSESNGNEDWHIQVNDRDGTPQFTALFIEQRILTHYIQAPYRLTSLDYQEDLSKIEKRIKELIMD